MLNGEYVEDVITEENDIIEHGFVGLAQKTRILLGENSLERLFLSRYWMMLIILQKNKETMHKSYDYDLNGDQKILHSQKCGEKPQ